NEDRPLSCTASAYLPVSSTLKEDISILTEKMFNTSSHTFSLEVGFK
ncbi:hypothetical protein MCHI_001029, partial [Candidatus Magnetoovum chiemensis]